MAQPIDIIYLFDILDSLSNFYPLYIYYGPIDLLLRDKIHYRRRNVRF